MVRTTQRKRPSQCNHGIRVGQLEMGLGSPEQECVTRGVREASWWDGCWTLKGEQEFVRWEGRKESQTEEKTLCRGSGRWRVFREHG